MKQLQLNLNLIPVIGIFGFGLLYLYASTLYPGGSQADLQSIGFDWIHNYWCNLLNEKGMNGVPNPAQPIAIFAMLLLCFSLMIFFYQFAKVYVKSRNWKIAIQWGGILSMLFASLMFTEYHDLMTIIASFFGLFAVIGIIKEIYSSKLKWYKISGIACILLLGINNFIYYSQYLIQWLPLIQKITLLLVLIWIIGLNFEIRKEIKLS